MGKSKQDRASIDLSGLRDRIDAYRLDAAWKNLSFSAKIRTLMEQQLNSSGASQEKLKPFAGLLVDAWEEVLASQVAITLKRLWELREGASPTEAEIFELANLLPYSVEQLLEICQSKQAPDEQAAAIAIAYIRALANSGSMGVLDLQKLADALQISSERLAKILQHAKGAVTNGNSR